MYKEEELRVICMECGTIKFEPEPGTCKGESGGLCQECLDGLISQLWQEGLLCKKKGEGIDT